MATVLQEFVRILVSGIVSLAEGVAAGVVAMAKALFLELDSTTGSVTGLSMFGGIVAIFAKKIGEVKSRKIGESFNTNTELTFLIS
jgi:hypothetical protein